MSETPSGPNAPQVLYELRSRAAWLTLDRPHKRNALSPRMIADLHSALDRAGSDAAVRAVVITGSGPAFCAGADIDAGDAIVDGDANRGSDDEGPRNPFARLLQRLQKFSKPVIVGVNGPAFGGGLGLVAVADIGIAARSASFSFSEVRLGLIPAMISVVVLPRIGEHHARRLFLTGRRFQADEAVDVGLIHRSVADDELEAAINEEVADIAKGGPNAVAEAKKLIREVPTLPKAVAFDRAAGRLAARLSSDEGREGMAAFLGKRPPSWRK
ncbi:MAG: enoyl-CoA hydratase-related protein [Acidobacteriota bacterium]